MYAIQVAGRPTFYLDENVQGIVDEAHAIRIAIEVMGLDGDGEDLPSYITAVKV